MVDREGGVFVMAHGGMKSFFSINKFLQFPLWKFDCVYY